MTDETGGMIGLRARWLPDRRDCVGAALAIAIVTGGPAHAEVRVSGDVTAVRVEATRSNVAEVISALESAFHVRVNTSVVLDSAVAGTFTGSLTQVVGRLLEGHNYFIRREAGQIEVTVVGMRGDRAIAAERPRPPAGYGLAQSRTSMSNSTLRNR